MATLLVTGVLACCEGAYQETVVCHCGAEVEREEVWTLTISLGEAAALANVTTGTRAEALGRAILRAVAACDELGDE